ncbi:hypothetical protein NDU88_004456 [Pleurodeles waltl]|uniref:Uncharacterized protein n=1 Tax=Pleurodeles waltl TaxID=8319 RepID=A0AAV7T7P2_PLEWA|nr:hypothetical protein NDU88_004456 [Pleurodeles waltl]
MSAGHRKKKRRPSSGSSPPPARGSGGRPSRSRAELLEPRPGGARPDGGRVGARAGASVEDLTWTGERRPALPGVVWPLVLGGPRRSTSGGQVECGAVDCRSGPGLRSFRPTAEWKERCCGGALGQRIGCSVLKNRCGARHRVEQGCWCCERRVVAVGLGPCRDPRRLA